MCAQTDDPSQHDVEVPDGTERCYFCHRPIVGGLFTLIDFGHEIGVQPVCDICREKADEDQDDFQD